MKINYSYALRNKILMVSGIVLLLLISMLGIYPAVRSVKENMALKNKVPADGALSHNPEYTAARARDLDMIMEQYRVDSADWRNNLWFRISELLPRRNVEVIYKLAGDEQSQRDPMVLSQDIEFEGNYKDLVLLIDTIQHIKGIGRISGLRMIRIKERDQAASKISMSLQFVAWKQVVSIR